MNIKINKQKIPSALLAGFPIPRFKKCKRGDQSDSRTGRAFFLHRPIWFLIPHMGPRAQQESGIKPKRLNFTASPLPPDKYIKGKL